MMSRNEIEAMELEAELGAAAGDPRRCPHHPHVKTSSPDGMFDAPCGECEAWMSTPREVILPRNRLTATPKGNGTQLGACASDLGLPPGDWPDIILIATRDPAGGWVMYEEPQAERTPDGDVVSFTYRVSPLSKARIPGCRNTRVVIFNT